MKRLKCIPTALVFSLLALVLVMASSPAKAQDDLESEKLARFVALMQYLRSDLTPSDVHANSLGTLDFLDDALTDIYIDGFIAPFTGETSEQVEQRLASVSGEDRYTAAMVESYRLASSPVLLDLVHDLLARYYVDLFTTGDLSGALDFLGKSEIQGLVAGFDSSDYTIPAPSATQPPGQATTPTRSQAEVESEKLARFVALMQYLRSDPTPSDVHANSLGTLDFLDHALTDIYIDGFIAPFTGETPEQVGQRLESVSEEDRYAAAMVESYRLASSPVLLDLMHDLLARYYVDLLTTGDLSGALDFLGKSEIQGLVAGFDSSDFNIPAPSAAQPPGIAEVRYIDDPEVPYLKWEIGPEVPDVQYQYFRSGILDMHRYASSLGLPPLPGYATFYIYHDPESAARILARLERRRLEDARQRFADGDWAGLAGLDPEDEDSGWIMVNLLAFARYEPWTYMWVAAHELSHVYQYTLQKHGHFDTTHQEVRVIGPAWMQEGFAEFHSARALAMGGVVPYEQSRQRLIRQSRRVDVQLEETETYDGLRAGPGRYDMAAMASELLAAKVGEEALISFWSLLGPETTWREAFEAAFGMTVEEFYPLFEEHRADGFPELDLPDIAPRTPLATADREALAALYDETGGVNWKNNGNWLTDEPGSNWHGVTTDREGHVTVLDLRDNRLSGELPPELGNLSRLRELNLRDNQLNGEIPPELGNLFILEVLSLVRNRLSGPIPPSLGNLANLKQLRIWGNQLNGEIPSTLANLSLLRDFSLGVNELTGDIPPWLGDLPYLQSIHLSENQLTGAIPDNLAKLTDVVYFNVNRNRLTGNIPSWLADFPLRQLYLNDNQLTGEIPKGLSDLPDLEWLWLGGNSLSGCVPGALRDIPNHDLDRLGLPDC